MSVDIVDIGRAAHQLSRDHGSRAHLYAEKLATEAAGQRQEDDAAFWRMVAATLRPRPSGANKVALESAIAPGLKTLGFRKKGLNWWRAGAETIAVINIQKSSHGTGIHVNLGVYVKLLGQEEMPPEYRCHVRARLERLAPESAWNEIVSADALVPPSAALLDAVLHDGVAWLDRVATLDGIRDVIRSGNADAVLAVRRLVGESNE